MTSPTALRLEEVLQALSGLEPAAREAVVAQAEGVIGAQYGGGMPVWLPNPGPQLDAYFCEADELFYGGQAGGGKALANQSLILTPTGWKAIGALKIGDSVCATDGTVQEVLGVYPQGERDLYRVTMRDGGSVLADLDHNWLAWRTHGATKSANVALRGAASARKWTTRQMLEEMAKGRREGKEARLRGFALPVTEPVRFNVAGQLKGPSNFVGREVEPYLLGLLLGDGSIGEKKIDISSADEEIVEAVQALAGADVAIDETKSNAVSLRFRGAYLIGLREALRRLELMGTSSGDKFIPRQYLFAPVDVRWALLQGLMDTDGWTEEKRACYYATVSPMLADGVEHLARSLGAVTSRTDKKPTFTYKGEKRSGKPAITLRLKFLEPEMAFRLSRKKAVASTISHQSMSRIVERIEFECRGPATCITVSNANSLYITEDFIVTHNTDLAVGLALTAHTRSLLLRKYRDDAKDMADRLLEVAGTRNGWNGQDLIFRQDTCTVRFGGCNSEEEKQRFKGKPFDLYVFDEISDFAEGAYTFIIGWNRSAKPGQRCRILATGNPPTTPEGLWVLRRWAAWLDPQHPKPAKPGELRWYTTGADGKEAEVAGRGPHLINGEMVEARSRTFIPAKLSDNPDLAATNYAATLAALPEELRAAYRDGRFDLGLKDAAYQVIPTAWVKAAQARWTPKPPAGVPMCAMGVDASGGGQDPMVIAPRHDGWYAPFIVIEGKDIPVERAGAHCAGLVLSHRRDDAKVIVDLGGGYGSSMYEQLHANNIDVQGYKGAEAAFGRTKCRQFGFANKRSAALWRFREALDPGQPGGSSIALPDDPELVADLTAPTYEPDAKVIRVESKVHVCERLGRSTNKGDATIMSFTSGSTSANIPGGFPTPARGRAPQVVMGRQAQRR